MKSARFEVYQDAEIDRAQWRWRLVAANGRIVATGESHRSKRDAERAVRGVIRLSGTAMLATAPARHQALSTATQP